MNKKDYILETITMEDVLRKYGIKFFKTKFSCPFHGKDTHPSAKLYDNSFYCFACNKGGDVIEFVEKYFNLDFKAAMEKINQDFNLGLEHDYQIDYSKINKIKNERLQKEKQREQLEKEFKNNCEQRWKYEEQLENINSGINIKNWEEKTKEQLSIRDLIMDIDTKLETINNKILNLK